MAQRLYDASPALNDLIKKSISLSPGPPERYRLQTDRVNLDTDGEVRRWTFGQKKDGMRKKTVMMVGQTGTGKTTLINTLVNYILGVTFEDKVWFEVTDEDQGDQREAQTSKVTAYEIASEKKTFFLTIIDTPGFGDTRGFDKDEKMPQNLKTLFQHETGVKDLDAVCLVLKASENRISVAQRYIFEAVLSLFGRDIKDSIVLFITHSDGGPPTNVLEAVKKEKIPCSKDEEGDPVYFLFNNRQAEKQQGRFEHIPRASWAMGDTSLEDFFKFLKPRPTRSTGMCADVLEQRVRIVACIDRLKDTIKHIEAKEKALTEIQNELQKNVRKIKENENVLFTIRTVYKEKVPVKRAKQRNRYVLCCNKCKLNCHKLCTARKIMKCKVFKANANCSVCKCPRGNHIKGRMKYVTRTKVEKVTYKDLISRYSHKQGAVAEKCKLQNVAAEHGKERNKKNENFNLENHLKENLDRYKKKKKDLVKEAYEEIIKLSVTALKPDSAFILQYLKFFIPRIIEIGEEEWAKKLTRMQTDAEKEATNVMEYMNCMIQLQNMKMK